MQIRQPSFRSGSVDATTGRVALLVLGNLDDTMLLSHRHGYLFVHLAKTGGTSVRAALSRQLWREPYALRTWLAQQLSASTGHRIGARIPRHAAAVAAREMLPPDVFASLFKFAFVRNPWDRVVSSYSHFQREYPAELSKQKIETFEQFVGYLLETPPERAERPAMLRALQRPQLESLVGVQGELLVDFVGRYERLEEDFSAILEQIPLPHIALPHKRKSQRSADYRASYSDELADRVAQHFADDIRSFQYSFDPEPQGDSSRLRRVSGGMDFQATIPLRPRIWSGEESNG